MGQQRDNKAVYENEELAWSTYSHRELDACEAYMIEKYLTDKNGRVLEAGTGSGRIAFHIEQQGFTSIDAFDYVEKMIIAAESVKGQIGSGVEFQVADAVCLNNYPKDTYDYAVYLQQVLGFIPRKDIEAAVKESYRVLKPGGTAIFSVLNFQSRSCNQYISGIVNLFRKLYGEDVHPQELPWLRLNGRPNWSFLGARQARVYWFTEGEIRRIMQDAGYTVLESVLGQNITGGTGDTGIYIACCKP